MSVGNSMYGYCAYGSNGAYGQYGWTAGAPVIAGDIVGPAGLTMKQAEEKANEMLAYLANGLCAQGSQDALAKAKKNLKNKPDGSTTTFSLTVKVNGINLKGSFTYCKQNSAFNALVSAVPVSYGGVPVAQLAQQIYNGKKW